MYQPDERYDIVEEALQDTKRGPIRSSRKLSIMAILGLAWVILDVILLGYSFLSGITLDTLRLLMVATITTPALGTFYFLFGFSRRYRFILGKLTERIGLGLLGLSILNMVACLLLSGSI